MAICDKHKSNDRIGESEIRLACSQSTFARRSHEKICSITYFFMAICDKHKSNDRIGESEIRLACSQSTFA